MRRQNKCCFASIRELRIARGLRSAYGGRSRPPGRLWRVYKKVEIAANGQRERTTTRALPQSRAQLPVVGGSHGVRLTSHPRAHDSARGWRSTYSGRGHGGGSGVLASGGHGQPMDSGSAPHTPALPKSRAQGTAVHGRCLQPPSENQNAGPGRRLAAREGR